MTGHGFNIHTIGIILLVVGAIGVLLSMIFWSSWGGVGGSRRGDPVPSTPPRVLEKTIQRS